MIEFVPYISLILLHIVVGTVALLLYLKSKKLGLALIALAFFLESVPNVVNAALGGPYISIRLYDQGFTATEIGMFHFYLFLLAITFHIAFVVLVLIGLIKLSRKV